MKASQSKSAARKGREAFSLVELLVAISLLSLIVLGLYSMFDRTQSALRKNVSQVDVLESGRAAIEILIADLQQANASGIPFWQIQQTISREKQYRFSHFSIRMNRVNGGFNDNEIAVFPSIQNLADGSFRTNILQETFFLTRSNLNWVGKGFFLSTSPTNPVPASKPAELSYGTLFRFSSPKFLDDQFQHQRQSEPPVAPNLSFIYKLAKTQGWIGNSNNVVASPLIDGVVHFRIQPLDSFGNPMRYWTQNPAIEITNQHYGLSVRLERDRTLPLPFAETRSDFYGNALPAFLDVELGVLDPATLARVKSFENPALAREFLERQAGGVHLFRRMIALPTAPNMARNLLTTSQ